MSEEKKHLENLQEIRSMMERNTRFLSLSGLSGIGAGVIALIGAFVAHQRIEAFTYIDYLSIMALELELLTIATCVLIGALTVAYLFTAKKAKKSGDVFWNKTSKKTLVSLAIPLVTGGLTILVLLKNGQYVYIAPLSLIFYGLACINASHHTVRDIFFLGLTNISLGLVALVYLGNGLLFWTIGFGFAHIIYGSLMYFKYDKKS